MKSFCATGVILLVGLGWAVSPAHAQSSYGTPSLLPLPNSAPLLPSSVPASYNYNTNNVEPFNSAFVSRQNQSTASETGQAPTLSFDEALHSPSGDCGTCGECCGEACCASGAKWFGAIGGLVMTRNRANPYWTTYETNNNVNQLMNTQNAGAGWAGGGQVTIGRSWACGCCPGPALAFTYWGIGPMNGFSSIRDPNNNLSTPIDLNTQTGPVMIGSQTAAHFFDNSREQRIIRNDRVNNFELNLFEMNLYFGPRLMVAPLVGFRYFRFDERLAYGATAAGHEFGEPGGADEAYLAFRCVNNLYGAQIGALINYQICDRLGVFFIPKAGIFGNQMNCLSQLYSADGQVGFNIQGHKNDAAFLGEIDTGLSWAFTPALRAYIGYRVVGVANLALADNQFLPFLADQQGFSEVKQSGALIMHGGMAGIAWAF